MDRTGTVRHWGVLSLAFPEVREYHRRRFLDPIAQGEWAGLFVCLRSESKPAEFADQFGFDDAIRADFLALAGRDIRREDFDLQAWRDLLGSYLTTFLRELRAELEPRSLRLGVGCAPQCPSLWHRLWPMHAGYGYLQDYLDGRGCRRWRSICG